MGNGLGFPDAGGTRSASLEVPISGTLQTLFVRTLSLEWGKAVQGTGVCDALAGSYHTALLYPVLPLGAKEWPDVGSPKHTSSHAARQDAP